MVADIQNFKVICEGGLNTNESSLALSADSPGAAVQLINFEPSSSGGYRRINGFAPLDAEFEIVGNDDAEGPVLGLVCFSNSVTRGFDFFAARKDKDEDTYSLYKLDSSGWEKQELPSPRNMIGHNSNVVRVRSETINFGSGNNLFLVDGVNPMLWFDGSDWKEISPEGDGTASSPGGNQALSAPSVIATYKNHLFVGCDQLREFVFAHSAPNNPIDWNVSEGAGQLFPGFDVVNMRPFRDELYIFGKSKIKKVAVSGTDFVLKDVTSDLGCIARDSLLEVGGDLIFLSQDGLRPISGTSKIGDVNLNLLSLPIQPNIETLVAQGDLQSLVGVTIRKKTQFRYFYNSEALAVEDSMGLLGCIRLSKRTGISWEFSELLGIRAYSTWSGMYADRELILHGDYNGGVYVQETGNSFNGKDILSIYSTPFIDLGDTERRILNRTIRVFTRFEGASEIMLGINFDWGDTDSLPIPNEYITNFDENSKYDYLTTIYDDLETVYGGAEISNIRKHIRGSSHSTQYSFVSEGIFPPFIIQGFVIEVSQKGRS